MNTPVIVNHIGFRPDDPLKRAVMPIGMQTSGFMGTFLFKVIRVSEFIKCPLNSPRGREELLWRAADIPATMKRVREAGGEIFVLNVGPRPWGDIHPDEQAVLREIGARVRACGC